jgi:hypothetical protein
MRHQGAQGDRLAEGRRDFEIEVGVDVGIQVEPAGLHKLHHRGPGEQLGDRADAEQGGGGIDRALRGHVGQPVAAFEQDLAVFDDDRYAAGDVGAAERERQEAVHEGGDIVLRQRMGRGCGGGGGCGLGCHQRCRWLHVGGERLGCRRAGTQAGGDQQAHQSRGRDQESHAHASAHPCVQDDGVRTAPTVTGRRCAAG